MWVAARIYGSDTSAHSIPQYVHALVASADKLLGLREPMFAHSEQEHRISEVGRAAVAVEVGTSSSAGTATNSGLRLGSRGRSSGGARQLPCELDTWPRGLELAAIARWVRH